jgi:hypothetical protein
VVECRAEVGDRMKQAQHAEDVGHYWQTSRSSPDTWIQRAKRELGALSKAKTYTLD